MHTQQLHNNLKSILLLLLFPCILMGVIYAFLVILNYMGQRDSAYGVVNQVDWADVNYEARHIMPWVLLIVGVWFLIS